MPNSIAEIVFEDFMQLSENEAEEYIRKCVSETSSEVKDMFIIVNYMYAWMLRKKFE